MVVLFFGWFWVVFLIKVLINSFGSFLVVFSWFLVVWYFLGCVLVGFCVLVGLVLCLDFTCKND